MPTHPNFNQFSDVRSLPNNIRLSLSLYRQSLVGLLPNDRRSWRGPLCVDMWERLTVIKALSRRWLVYALKGVIKEREQPFPMSLGCLLIVDRKVSNSEAVLSTRIHIKAKALACLRP